MWYPAAIQDASCVAKSVGDTSRVYQREEGLRALGEQEVTRIQAGGQREHAHVNLVAQE